MKKKVNFNVSIKFKLIIIFIILITLPLLVLGYTSYSKSVEVTKGELEKSSLQLIKQLDTSIDAYLGGIEESVLFISKYVSSKEALSNPDENEGMIKSFENFKNTHKNILNIYIGTEDKKAYSYLDVEKDSDFTARPWYIKAKQQKKLVWTDPYIDLETGKTIVSVALPLHDNNEFIGVLGTDITLDTLDSMLDGTVVGDQGYPCVVDENGNTLLHRNKQFIGKPVPIEKLAKELEEKREGVVKYEIKEDGVNRDKFAVFTTMDKFGWKVMAAMHIDEIKEKTDIILKQTVMLGGVSLLVAMALAFLFATSLTSPIRSLVTDMKSVQEGDLSVNRMVKRRDEIGQLEEHFNSMVGHLGKLVKRIQESSINVTSSAQNIAATSEITSATAQQIASSIEIITQGASEQAVEAEKSVTNTLKLASQFNKLATNFEDMNTFTDHVIKTSKASMAVVDELEERTKLNNEGTEKIQEAIVELDKKIKNIGNILNTIDSISNQTNLLALNASIEAARAGEAGRGFTVVAEQIRKLAEESSISSCEIKEIIANVQAESEITVAIMKEVKSRNEGQSEAVIEVNQSFDQISDAVYNITEKIEQIGDFVNHMNQDKDNIVASIENISGVSEEIAASSEEVNNSVQQQATVIEHIALASDEMDVIATSLNEEIDRFKL